MGMMVPGELWRHKITGRVVRIERSREGFLSVSAWVALWKDGRWCGEFQMVDTLWDEAEFQRKFSPLYARRQ
jgi:hypothetical protein